MLVLSTRTVESKGFLIFESLRHSKIAKAPDLKDWMNAMVQVASYESVLRGLEDGISSWAILDIW